MVKSHRNELIQKEEAPVREHCRPEKCAHYPMEQLQI